MMPWAVSDLRLSGNRATRVSPGAVSLRMPKSNLPPQPWVGLDEYNGTRNGVPRHPEKIIEHAGARSCDVGHSGTGIGSILHAGAVATVQTPRGDPAAQFKNQMTRKRWYA